MIIVGNQRGGARDLAAHLLKQENERVEVHELRGFASTDLREALQESQAVSRATKCKQHLFSMSLNPPKEADVSENHFKAAIGKAEERLGLENQPRAIVFHTKDGRKHAHAVWCRINTDEMKAVQLSHSKRKMQDVSRELYLEHGWVMPRGHISHEARDPASYTLAEWQQAKRAERDPKALKTMFVESWAISDGKEAFAAALKERGFILARGDRRGHVAVDHRGEAYAISKWTGQKAKDVRAKLGDDLSKLPSVDEGRNIAAKRITDRLVQLKEQERRKSLKAVRAANAAKQSKAEQHMQDREALKKALSERMRASEAEREARLRKGLLGVLDRVTGRRKATLARNSVESALQNDQHQARLKRQFDQQTNERSQITETKRQTATQNKAVQTELKTDIAALNEPAAREERKAAFKRKRTPTAERPKRTHSRDGPTFER